MSIRRLISGAGIGSGARALRRHIAPKTGGVGTTVGKMVNQAGSRAKLMRPKTSAPSQAQRSTPLVRPERMPINMQKAPRTYKK